VMLNVFTLKGGVVRHSFGTEMHSSPSEPGQDPRHVDSIWPLWSLLDFTPEGRGDFHPKLQYADGTPEVSSLGLTFVGDASYKFTLR
jgi:hypothetical protein